MLSPANTIVLGKPRLRLRGIPGTASDGKNIYKLYVYDIVIMLLFFTVFDFHVTGSSDILIQSAAGIDVPVDIRDDDLVGEPIENFTITSKPPRYGGAPFLFRDSVVNIIDADGKWVL